MKPLVKIAATLGFALMVSPAFAQGKEQGQEVVRYAGEAFSVDEMRTMAPPGSGGTYVYTTFRTISDTEQHGCQFGEVDCLKNICIDDLTETGGPVKRGETLCYKNLIRWFCIMECSQIRRIGAP